MRYLIEANGVKKSFKKVRALKNVHLDVQSGEFIALLGPNGAGKTTLVEIIEGIQKPDEGTILIKGMNWNEHRQQIHQIIGISLQETFFFERITVLETLKLFASFFSKPISRVEFVLNHLRLTEKANAWTIHLSGGQKQKLALAIALINEPELLLLDEPTTGLDPTARREIWDLLFALKKAGQTSMILTTHYMEEAQYLCDRIIILDEGAILKEGTLGKILEESGCSNLDELFVAMTGRRLDDENNSATT
ncbi:MAG: ABC transporter ATP-binding protein [Oligoflexia bacterium]|nr:ABC transporter ATP-binding protein [Oligoflexia bacterium]